VNKKNKLFADSDSEEEDDENEEVREFEKEPLKNKEVEEALNDEAPKSSLVKKYFMKEET
jgi:hypothetical protein